MTENEPQVSTWSHNEPQIIVMCYNEPKQVTMTKNMVQWITRKEMHHNEPQWAKISHIQPH